MVDTTSKSWGWSTRVYYDPGLQVEKIFIRAGGYSSVHLHIGKVNQFVILSGMLQVNFFNDTNGIIHCESIRPGGNLVVPVNSRHQFMARTDVHGFEVYWSDRGSIVEPSDIMRFSTNGVDMRCGARPFDIKHVWCCECNKEYNLHDVATVCIDNAIRDMCQDCVSRTGAREVTDGMQQGT